MSLKSKKKSKKASLKPNISRSVKYLIALRHDYRFSILQIRTNHHLYNFTLQHHSRVNQLYRPYISTQFRVEYMSNIICFLFISPGCDHI